ncbi:MAG: hypothetical protein IJP38_10065 [Oscillospiraceae bacterium]|nr:hypothetical protein [Oscillospiraceae bacterium]
MDNPSKKSTKRFLIIYSIAIFLFAVSLILIASFSQMRINREAEQIREQLNSAEILAADKNTKLDAAMTENSRLKTKVEELEAQLETLTTQKEEDTKKLATYNSFAEIINLDRLGKKTALKEAITAFEDAGYPALLSPEHLEIYNSIK